MSRETIVLITGASGYIGGILRERLARSDRQLRLFDGQPLPTDRPQQTSECFVSGSITDFDQMRAAARGVAVIVHLAALHHPEIDTVHAWSEIESVNVRGTLNVFEAARQEQVPRVVFASSNHAVGFYPTNQLPAPDYLFPRPDTFYGVSKVAGEALGSLYHYRYGLEVACLRILTCVRRPHDVRSLATWLSPSDTGRLFEAAISCPALDFIVAWGVSANSRAWFDMGEATRMGYIPQDNAEDFRDELVNVTQGISTDDVGRFLGGARARPDVDDSR